MNRLHTPSRFPMMLASLALLVVPFGCNSDTKTTAEVPTPPTVVVEAPAFGPAPMPGTAPGAVEPPGIIDPSVQQTASELNHDAHKDAADAKKEVHDAEGDVKKAVGEVEGEAKDKAKEVEADARKSAEDALNNLLPAPK
jgi:hypothetical protein